MSNFAVSSAKAAFNLATFSSTSLSLMVASSSYSVASLRALRFGSMSWMTSQYMTMLMTQEQTPLAAGDLDSMTSGLKWSRARNMDFTAWTLEAGTWLASTMSLKDFSFSTNCSGFFINFTEDFQSQALGFLFLSMSMASGKNPARRNTVAENTSGTPAGGLDQDLAV